MIGFYPVFILEFVHPFNLKCPFSSATTEDLLDGQTSQAPIGQSFLSMSASHTRPSDSCSLLVAPAKSIGCVAEQRKKKKHKHLLLIVANTGCLRLLSEQAAAEKSTPFVCAKEGLPCGGFWPACTCCFSRFISSRNPHPQSSFFFDSILLSLYPSSFLSLLAVHFHTRTNN